MISDDVELGEGVRIPHPELVNLYGCRIGDGSKIAAFVEIQRDVIIGRNVKIEAYAFLPSGVRVADGAFIGPHVCFTNDHYPRAVDASGRLLGAEAWTETPTVVREGASIGAGAVVVCGVTIGSHAMIGAGSVVTRSVRDRGLVWGNPARERGTVPDADLESAGVRPGPR